MKSQKQTPNSTNSPSGVWANNKIKIFFRDLIGPLEGRFL